MQKFQDKMKYLELKNQLLKQSQKYDKNSKRIKVYLMTNITPRRWVTPETIKSI